MSAITPQTDVYLLKAPLEIDNNNQLTFNNTTAQYNYFSSLPKIPLDNFTYQRKDGVIKVPRCVDDLLQYNYVMYRNEGFSNKWFYAYITGMEFLNPNTTGVSIKTDVWQTWQFSLSYKPTFVEREHVNDDTIGAHTLPEGLELGEYQVNDTSHFPISGESIPDGATPFYVCFCVSEPPEPNNPIPIVPTTGYDMGAVFTPLTFFAVSTANGFEDAREIIEWYRSSADTIDTAVVNMYMIPYTCVDTTVSQTWTRTSPSASITVYAVKSSNVINYALPVIEADVMAGSYSPRNNKLFTYPYCYLYLNNKSGEDVVYHWEDGATMQDTGRKAYYFKGCVVPSASISAKLFPTYYKGKNESSPYYSLWNYGINFGKIPVCAWTNDYYTNWLTQNGVNVATNLATNVGKSVIGASMGVNPAAAIGGAVSIASSIANTVAEVHKADITPPQAAGDVNTGDVTFAYTFNNITAYQMTIRKEVAEVIDGYFDMFGYKVSTVKTPNITGRRNWNYVKTHGCYIEAQIPQGDLQEIKDLFDKGITLWHNASTFGDYSQSNDII